MVDGTVTETYTTPHIIVVFEIYNFRNYIIHQYLEVIFRHTQSLNTSLKMYSVN